MYELLSYLPSDGYNLA